MKIRKVIFIIYRLNEIILFMGIGATLELIQQIILKSIQKE